MKTIKIVSTEYVAGIGWMYVIGKSRYGSFDTMELALIASKTHKEESYV